MIRNPLCDPIPGDVVMIDGVHTEVIGVDRRHGAILLADPYKFTANLREYISRCQTSKVVRRGDE